MLQVNCFLMYKKQHVLTVSHFRKSLVNDTNYYMSVYSVNYSLCGFFKGSLFYDEQEE